MWKVEHGSEYEVPPVVARMVEQGKLFDHSYHNDVCPRFDSSVSGGGVTLWVEHEVASKRECPARFAVQSYDANYNIVADIYVGDDLSEALAAIEQHR